MSENDKGPASPLPWNGGVSDMFLFTDGKRAPIGAFPNALDHAYVLQVCNAYPGLVSLIREFIAYWTTDRAHGGDVGCGMCGGIPHSTTCYVGRMAELLPPDRRTQ